MKTFSMVLVVPVNMPGLKDDALRLSVWQQSSAFLLGDLGKKYARFEPAAEVRKQKIDRPYSVVLGRNDPALFLFLYATAKDLQGNAVTWHLKSCLDEMDIQDKKAQGNVIFCSVDVKGDGKNLAPHLMWHLAMMRGEFLPDSGLYYLREHQALATEELDKEVLGHMDRYALCAVTLVAEDSHEG